LSKEESDTKQIMEVTRGALQRIFASEPNFQPVLQITSVKEFPSHAGSGPPRYKCMVSDHVQTGATAMLASQLGHLATSGELSDGCLFHLTEFMINDVGNSKCVFYWHLFLCVFRVVDSRTSSL